MQPTNVSAIPKSEPSACLPAPPNNRSTPTRPSEGQLLLDQIRHLGRTLDDLQSLRVRHNNRRGAFERAHTNGLPLPPDMVAVLLDKSEREATNELKQLWRKHSLASWASAVRGVGEKSIARLIAEIGDPADRATVSQLWAYCGYDPTRRLRKGMTQEEVLGCGNRRAKSQCYLIATSLVKAGVRSTPDGDRYPISPAGERYLAVKSAELAKGCTPGHAHNRALRILSKDFLRDLWIASRQVIPEDQDSNAGGNS